MEKTVEAQGPVDVPVSLDDLYLLRTIALEATQGQWQYGATPCFDKIKAMEIVEENLDATKEPIDFFFEVFLADGRRTAIVGNGPKSEENSRFIATFSPPNVMMLLETLERLMLANA